MKENKKFTISILLLGFFAFTFYAFSPNSVNPGGWEVPANYKTMANPVAGDEEAMEIGGELYAQHCKSCHGKTGLGDGPKAAELDTESGDFSESEFQSQSDGEIFYKTTFGRDDMPAFDKKISDEDDRWMLVTYVRSFKE